MATLLNTGIIGGFAPIFTFLFIWVVAYAVLTKSKLVDNNGLSSLIAFVLGFISLFFKPAVVMINLMAPWFVVVFIFAFMIILMFMLFGVKMDQISKVANKPSIYWTIITIGIVIALFSFSEAVNVIDSDNSTSLYESHFKQVTFTPQVLGVLLILIIAGFCIAFLAKE